MTPRKLLRDVLALAQSLKETYTADNGISDIHPTLIAYDRHGNRLVSVLLHDGSLGETGTVTVAMTSAWQPWAVAHIAEGYVRRFDEMEDFEAEAERTDHDFARDFGSGDKRVMEALVIALYLPHHPSISIASPFRYATAHTVEWLDAGPICEGEGGNYDDVMRSAVTVEPMPGFPMAQARMECIDYLRGRGCVVVT